MTAIEVGQRTVVVAWDGSRTAAEAFPVARALAADLNARVELLHVHPTGISSADARKQLGSEGVDIEGYDLRIEVDGGAPGILSVTRDPAVDVIVISSRGGGHPGLPGLGSVARGVLAGGRKPVLVLRPSIRFHAQPRFRRLLLPIAGSPVTSAALAPLARLAARLGASLDFLYVHCPGQRLRSERGGVAAPRYVDQPQHEWQSWMTESVERVMACVEDGRDLSLRMHLAHGEPAREIVRYAEKEELDLIALVRRSKLQPGRARVLRAVVDQAGVPVLVLGADK